MSTPLSKLLQEQVRDPASVWRSGIVDEIRAISLPLPRACSPSSLALVRRDYGCLRSVTMRSGGKVSRDIGRLWTSKPSFERVSRYSRVCRKSEMTVSPPGFNTRAISLQVCTRPPATNHGRRRIRRGQAITPQQAAAHYRVNALGFASNVILPARKVSMGVKYSKEFSDRSTFQGYSLQISGAITF